MTVTWILVPGAPQREDPVATNNDPHNQEHSDKCLTAVAALVGSLTSFIFPAPTDHTEDVYGSLNKTNTSKHNEKYWDQPRNLAVIEMK